MALLVSAIAFGVALAFDMLLHMICVHITVCAHLSVLNIACSRFLCLHLIRFLFLSWPGLNRFLI